MLFLQFKASGHHLSAQISHFSTSGGFGAKGAICFLLLLMASSFWQAPDSLPVQVTEVGWEVRVMAWSLALLKLKGHIAPSPCFPPPVRIGMESGGGWKVLGPYYLRSEKDLKVIECTGSQTFAHQNHPGVFRTRILRLPPEILIYLHWGAAWVWRF